MDKVSIFKPGTSVKIKTSLHSGWIISALVSIASVKYLIGYFNNGAYLEIYLEAYQFEVDDESQIKIGFK